MFRPCIWKYRMQNVFHLGRPQCINTISGNCINKCKCDAQLISKCNINYVNIDRLLHNKICHLISISDVLLLYFDLKTSVLKYRLFSWRVIANYCEKYTNVIYIYKYIYIYTFVIYHIYIIYIYIYIYMRGNCYPRNCYYQTHFQKNALTILG